MATRLILPALFLASATAQAAPDAVLVGGTSWIAWVLGLVCGIALMVLTTLEWLTFHRRVTV